MPVRGRLRCMLHVPGDLYSVSPATVAAIPGLFARNERVVCHFDTDYGPLAMVLVGATIVGSMATVWHGRINPPRPGSIRRWDYVEDQVVLERGAEMGRFLLGSTVVMLWPHDCAGYRLRFPPHWRSTAPVRMGEAMAHAEPIHAIIG
jgi:Phosphatidylserine decarboxylase